MLKLHNTLTRKKEKFTPLNPPHVGMYTCGPTVYDFAHIGNFRTYTTADLLVRALRYNGYDVTYVMNITDVGHLTGDNLGDADTGEDRMEKSAQKAGKSAWEIADFYTKAFFKDYEKLHLTKPYIFSKATEHIQEQINLIKRLEKKGYTYKISDGIYFDTAKFPDYGKLSFLDQIKAGARVEPNPEKKNPRDFALWKFSYPHGESRPLSAEGGARQMEWDSPWGVGFPGWHIECSAMSMKYLGETFDIHVGGIDLSATHHPNEIAQAEAATGKPFVQYWIHGAFILVDGQRMSKSLGNNYTVDDLIERGFDPLALRYLYMQTHYQQEMNFTFESLTAAQHALENLRSEVAKLGGPSHAQQRGSGEFEQAFSGAIDDNLNMPNALRVVWELVKSNRPGSEKVASLMKFDQILGFDLHDVKEKKQEEIPEEIEKLIKERENLRLQKQFAEADAVREQIYTLGYMIEDTNGQTVITKVKKRGDKAPHN